MTLNLPSSSISLRSELLTGSDSETEIEKHTHKPFESLADGLLRGLLFCGGRFPLFLPSPPPSRQGKRNAKGREKPPKEGRGQDKLLPLPPRNTDIDNVDKQSNTRWLCR